MEKLLELLKEFLKIFSELFDDGSSKKNNTENRNNFKSIENKLPSTEISNDLDLYFDKLLRYFKYDFFSDYKGYFFSISIESIKKLEQNYPEIKANTIKFPFYSDSLTENMLDILLYLNNKLKSQNKSISDDRKNDYNFLLKEFKKHLAKGAHFEVLQNIEGLINKDSSKEIEKWQELYNSEPSSMLI